VTASLTRSSAAKPVRAVHIGLGAFHRAHQAWYTAHAVDGEDWGIAAYTGRSPDAARALSAQDGLYTLIERGPRADRAEIVDAISVAVDGSDVGHLIDTLSRPEVSVVTLTITEAGYGMRAGRPTEVAFADAEIVAAAGRGALTDGQAPRTAIGRLTLALEARRRAEAGPLTVVPCDNMPDNGALTRDAVMVFAERLGDEAVDYVHDQVGFVSTSVDRITPRTTDADRADARRLTGFDDASPVVAEPFSDWTLADGFRSDAPAWQTAGARIVPDVAPYERRKLWLLNGSHTLLAAAGMLRGSGTVDEAIADPVIAQWVEEFWDECEPHLPADLAVHDYRARLRERFENDRIHHALDQIAADTQTKLQVRISPVLRAERAAGRRGTASSRVFAAWIALDAQQNGLGLPTMDDVRSTIAAIDPTLAADDDLVADIRALAKEQNRAADRLT
jgi:fructuronate reductase